MAFARKMGLSLALLCLFASSHHAHAFSWFSRHSSAHRNSGRYSCDVKVTATACALALVGWCTYKNWHSFTQTTLSLASAVHSHVFAPMARSVVSLVKAACERLVEDALRDGNYFAQDSDYGRAPYVVEPEPSHYDAEPHHHAEQPAYRESPAAHQNHHEQAPASVVSGAHSVHEDGGSAASSSSNQHQALFLKSPEDHNGQLLPIDQVHYVDLSLTYESFEALLDGRSNGEPDPSIDYESLVLVTSEDGAQHIFNAQEFEDHIRYQCLNNPVTRSPIRNICYYRLVKGRQNEPIQLIADPERQLIGWHRVTAERSVDASLNGAGMPEDRIRYIWQQGLNWRQQDYMYLAHTANRTAIHRPSISRQPALQAHRDALDCR